MRAEDVVKVASLSPDCWHVDDDGKRVTPETCTCSQCAMQRAMQAQLDSLDETHWRASYAMFDREQIERSARRRAERRQRVINAFIKAGFTGCTMPMVIRIPMKVEQAQIEVARDAWQEDEGASGRWRELLAEHPVAIQNYIGKRFEKERDDLAHVAGLIGVDETAYRPQRFRITSLAYAPEGDLWAVTDNTPGE